MLHVVGGASLKELEIPAQSGWHQGRGVPLLARWDSGWYAGLADHGYAFSATEQSTAGFFPLYSLMMRGASALLSVSSLVSGSIVSALCLLIALFLALQYSKAVDARADPWTAVFVLLSFPSSFILASVYSESLFLVCVLGSYLLARRGSWRASAVLAALASLTRVHGLALIPTLLVEAYLRRRQENVRWTAYVPAMGALAGFAALCVYFAVKFDDPWAYFHSKQAWGLRDGNAWPVFFNDLKIFFLGWENGYANTRLSRSLGVLFGIGWIVASAVLLKKRRLPEATWMIAYMALTFAGGGHVLWGASRYTLCMFPLLTLLPGRLAQAWILVGCLTQSLLLIEFVNALPNVP